MTDDLVKKLRENTDFQAFLKWLGDTIEDLNTVSGIEEMSNEQAGEEVRARLKAILMLEKILQPFLDFSERRKPSLEQLDKAKRRAGL